MVATYLGRTWWDNEIGRQEDVSAGQADQPDRRRKRSESSTGIPKAHRLRGLWSDSIFCRRPARPNSTQAEERAVCRFARSRLDVSRTSTRKIAREICSTRTTRSSRRTIPNKFKKAVHLKDIHLERGMHCVDCHFRQDCARHRHSLQRTARGGRDRLRRLSRLDAASGRTRITSGPAAHAAVDDREQPDASKRKTTDHRARSDAPAVPRARRTTTLACSRSSTRDAKRKDENGQRRSVEKRRHRSELDRRARPLVAGDADRRHGHAGQSAITTKSRRTPRRCSRTTTTWGDAPADERACSRIARAA